MSENKKIVYAFLILGAGLFILRLPTLFELPGLDQAFSAYAGQKMREGQLLYRDVWDHRPPGIYFLYSWIPYSGGNQPWIIPLIDVLYTLLTLGALLLLAKNLRGSKTAIGAAFIFILFSLTPVLQRSWSRNQPDMLINLPLILCLYYGYLGFCRQRYFFWFLSGLALGVAFIIKFTALFILLPLIPLWGASPLDPPAKKNFKLKNLSYAILGWTVPVAATIFYLYIKGVLPEAYEALVTFNRVYATEREQLKFILTVIIEDWQGQVIFIFAVLFLMLLGLGRKNFYRTLGCQILILWALAALFSVVIQGKYFPHYFLSLIPPLSILAGSSLELVKNKNEGRKSVIISLLVVALLSGATGDVLRDYFHAYRPDFVFRFSRINYDQTVRSLPVNKVDLAHWELGRFIAQNSQEKDYIYIWGMAPEIYYYSGRPSPNCFIFQYFLMDANNPLAKKFSDVKKRRQELLDNLKAKPVKFILVGLKNTSMFEHKAPLKTLEDFPELHQWIRENYFFVARSRNYLILQKKETGSNE